MCANFGFGALAQFEKIQLQDDVDQRPQGEEHQPVRQEPRTKENLALIAVRTSVQRNERHENERDADGLDAETDPLQVFHRRLPGRMPPHTSGVGGRDRPGTSTQAAAARISAKPTRSAAVGRSPSISIELPTPMTGVASEADDVGRCSMMANRKR